MTAKIKPLSNGHLRELVTSLLQERGFDCDLNDIDVSAITDFTRVFMVSHNTKFIGDISKWDVSNAVSMTQMFENCEFNGDISNWNTSKVTHMTRMFSGSNFRGDLSRWNTSAVEQMMSMLEFTKLDCDLSKWDTRRVKSMFRMFFGASFNQDIRNWNVAACESFGQMFLAAKFNGDISSWALADTAQVPSVFEDSQLASFKEPNFYHWYVLSSKRGPDIQGLPAKWKEHGVAARTIGMDMGMPDHEIWHWAQKSWNEKQGLQLALPEGLNANTLC